MGLEHIRRKLEGALQFWLRGVVLLLSDEQAPQYNMRVCSTRIGCKVLLDSRDRLVWLFLGNPKIGDLTKGRTKLRIHSQSRLEFFVCLFPFSCSLVEERQA